MSILLFTLKESETRMKNRINRFLQLSMVVSILIVGNGCIGLFFDTSDTDDDDTNDTTNIVDTINNDTINNEQNFYNIFPFTEQGNWWMLTDEHGKLVKVEVTNKITSNQKVFFQIRYQEGTDTIDNWFKKTSDGVFFCDSIDGDFLKLFPGVCSSKGGRFFSNKRWVSYDYAIAIVYHQKVFDNVFDFKYPGAGLFKGFEEISAAENIGIVRLYDIHDPVNNRYFEYVLDSASIGGMIHRFTY